MVFEGIGEPEYDEFFDETRASFKSAYCKLCGWKVK